MVTRPDILYDIGVINQFKQSPRQYRRDIALQVLDYYTQRMGILELRHKLIFRKPMKFSTNRKDFNSKK